MPAESLTIPPEAARLLRHSAERLAERFADAFSPETVAECLDDSYIVLAATARVRDHLYVLAERFAAERLAATAKATGLAVADVPEVLFVCVHNAGRSQMAAALLAHHAAGRVVVRSAGSAPVDQVNPAVVTAIEEIGLDVSQEFPKPLTDETVRASDVVVTMGCGDACPIYPGKRYLNWELDDPAGQSLETVRGIRDDLDARVQTLLRELLGQA
ncbi:arsenate reductase/protein-tyrosine-phosphatase family protein [Glycomyces albidus]|uniref:Arsenate reductase ArsC n=1 Tax=Glycomyces albidus TaxID=2656774 RepID=A0A6L5GB38_9ACTN|nr:arsenate reductase ArsC [Glycomyces albidus]MQM26897.1 arsenate reductase ArsC [Glycomyces albidus]